MLKFFVIKKTLLFLPCQITTKFKIMKKLFTYKRYQLRLAGLFLIYLLTQILR